MKNTLWIFLFLLTASFSCENNENIITDQDLVELEREIIALSESVSCTNSSEWEFTAMGSKACGGPTRYIAFHQSVSDEFLDLVSQFTRLQEEYNLRYHVVSDCMLVAPPRSVTCEAGKPVLVY
ncbi:MAG: hypothetical protein B7Z16_00910 [Algoriphagus sp. 32-45-6]|nr:MAG: hypothetical protein B7Z16_00910 [Algoriphagus sp. 32-45-6]